MMTPAEGALKILEQLAKIGKIEIYQQGKTMNVRYLGKWQGEPVQFQAVEPSLIEAVLTIGRQAAGRK